MLLIEKTKDVYGYDPLTLKPSSHKKVFVSCDYCSCELEKRYYRYTEVKNKGTKDCCKKCKNKKTNEVIRNTTGYAAKTEKMKATNLERYGNVVPINSKELQEKLQEKNLKLYGTKHGILRPETQEKIKESTIKSCGVDNPFKSETVQENITKTMISKYGVKKFAQLQISEDSRNKLEDPMFLNNEHTILKKTINQISSELNVSVFTLIKYLSKHNITINKYKSAGEHEVTEYVKSLLVDPSLLVENDRTVLSPLELDVYLPTQNIAIEYCGLYWHSEASPDPKTRTYHHNKYKNCKNLNIRLVTIFEDEWINHQSAVKNMLKSIICKSSNKIYARNTETKEISFTEYSKFCKEYHIQGSPKTTKYNVGIFYNNTLYGVCSFSLHHRQGNEKTLILSRMAFLNDVHIIGGASKMLADGIEYAKANGFDKIITWSDNRYGEGNVYSKIGFGLVAEYGPDYSYVASNHPQKRISKQSCQKKYLNCSPGQTELERTKELGLSRIWDCGKKKWEINVK
jgi:hypothetical protein